MGVATSFLQSIDCSNFKIFKLVDTHLCSKGYRPPCTSFSTLPREQLCFQRTVSSRKPILLLSTALSHHTKYKAHHHRKMATKISRSRDACGDRVGHTELVPGTQQSIRQEIESWFQENYYIKFFKTFRYLMHLCK